MLRISAFVYYIQAIKISCTLEAMKDFWDSRYSDAEYAYGEAPNEYLKQQLAKFTPGKILFPADGEGRNGVYAATLGWDVYSFDISKEGKKKAVALAVKRGVKIQYDVKALEATRYAPASFDALVQVYAHFPADKKSEYQMMLNNYLRPGGIVILEAFSKKHLRYSSVNEKAGGPKDINMLYSIEEMRELFAGFDILELEEVDTVITEGKYHDAMSCVIRFTGVKR